MSQRSDISCELHSTSSTLDLVSKEAYLTRGAVEGVHNSRPTYVLRESLVLVTRAALAINYCSICFQIMTVQY